VLHLIDRWYADVSTRNWPSTKKWLLLARRIPQPMTSLGEWMRRALQGKLQQRNCAAVGFHTRLPVRSVLRGFARTLQHGRGRTSLFVHEQQRAERNSHVLHGDAAVADAGIGHSEASTRLVAFRSDAQWKWRRCGLATWGAGHFIGRCSVSSKRDGANSCR